MELCQRTGQRRQVELIFQSWAKKSCRMTSYSRLECKATRRSKRQRQHCCMDKWSCWVKATAVHQLHIKISFMNKGRAMDADNIMVRKSKSIPTRRSSKEEDSLALSKELEAIVLKMDNWHRWTRLWREWGCRLLSKGISQPLKTSTASSGLTDRLKNEPSTASSRLCRSRLLRIKTNTATAKWELTSQLQRYLMMGNSKKLARRARTLPKEEIPSTSKGKVRVCSTVNPLTRLRRMRDRTTSWLWIKT